MIDDARTRILRATVACLGRYGIAKTNVDDAAREAGVARATVYRHFPDGKDQLIAESITWAVAQFFTELALAVDDAPDFPTFLERSLVHARRAVDEHEVLQKVLETEPERLLPQLTQSAPLVMATLGNYLAERLEGEQLRPGMDAAEAGDWLARMGLSFILAEGGGTWPTPWRSVAWSARSCWRRSSWTRRPADRPDRQADAATEVSAAVARWP